jgi:mRNA-degrading endonuclease RelE of RelBE toxin-antitoxin system
MNFYTSSTFRKNLESLTKKSREGYMSVTKDICQALTNMPDNILRDTNDRVRQLPDYRIVKLRLPNSGQHLPKANGFRLIYWVSLLTDDVVLLSVYPKRGPQSAVDLVDSEYGRLIKEMTDECLAHTLHQVDIFNGLAELSQIAGL